MAQDKDRRGASRARMSRRTVFVAIDGSTLLQEGMVVDMSRDGLRVVTRQPASVGKVIELEIDPREDSHVSSPIITRGRVVRVDDLGDGDYAVAVKFRFRQNTTQPVRTPAPVARKSAATQQSRRNPWSLGVYARKGWKKWAAGTMAVFAVLGLFLFWPRDASSRADDPVYAGGNSLSSETVLDALPKSKLKPSDETSRGGKIGNGGSGMLVVPNADQSTLRRVSKAPESVKANPDEASEMEPVREASIATAVVSASDDSLSIIRSALAKLEQSRGKQASDTSSTAKLNAAPALDQIEELIRAVAPALKQDRLVETEPGAPYLSQGVHLRVQKDTYSLTVYRDGKPFTQYPISLGANDATPTGLFTIHNKIQNPDWNNKGERVPFGDPKNPLGECWMGFARDGQPTSFGIHPTSEPDAIGKSVGLGCVRLKPEHAKALFRLCPIGATVTIQ